jgi:hypothetical protein
MSAGFAQNLVVILLGLKMQHLFHAIGLQGILGKKSSEIIGVQLQHTRFHPPNSRLLACHVVGRRFVFV